jgi:hypothetical protein
MGTELPTEVMLWQTLVLMQMIFLNNVKRSRQISSFQNFLLLLLVWFIAKRHIN